MEGSTHWLTSSAPPEGAPVDCCGEGEVEEEADGEVDGLAPTTLWESREREKQQDRAGAATTAAAADERERNATRP